VSRSGAGDESWARANGRTTTNRHGHQREPRRRNISITGCYKSSSVIVWPTVLPGSSFIARRNPVHCSPRDAREVRRAPKQDPGMAVRRWQTQKLRKTLSVPRKSSLRKIKRDHPKMLPVTFCGAYGLYKCGDTTCSPSRSIVTNSM
jgi:hypothetical protein